MSLSKRDTFVRYIDPLNTIWEDAEGNTHFSVKDALRAFELADTPENRESMKAIWREVAQKANPDVTILERSHPDSVDYFTQNQDPTKQ